MIEKLGHAALCIGGAIVILALVGSFQYVKDRDDHRASFITDEHVTNLHHELANKENRK